MLNFPATLVGCAIGDALGMPVEGWPKERIKKHVGHLTEMLDPIILLDPSGKKLTEDEFGPIHNWTEVFHCGEYTDDTILTLAIAESIIERGLPDLHHICQKQLSIFEDFSQGRNKCGFGGTTIEAFKNLQKGMLPTKSGVIGGPGTGPPMKMAPIGMWMAAGPKFGYLRWKQRLQPGRYIAKLVGQSTHLDPRSWLSGILQADAIWRCLIQKDGGSSCKNFFIQELLKLANEWAEPLSPEFSWYNKSLIERLEWVAQNKDVTVEEAHAYLGSTSSVYRAYPFVLWMFQKFWDDPVDGLVELVNCGGDCDTTGAMFGSLVGARHGMIFPARWCEKLKNIDSIIALGEQFEKL